MFAKEYLIFVAVLFTLMFMTAAEDAASIEENGVEEVSKKTTKRGIYGGLGYGYYGGLGGYGYYGGLGGYYGGYYPYYGSYGYPRYYGHYPYYGYGYGGFGGYGGYFY